MEQKNPHQKKIGEKQTGVLRESHQKVSKMIFESYNLIVRLFPKISLPTVEANQPHT